MHGQAAVLTLVAVVVVASVVLCCDAAGITHSRSHSHSHSHRHRHHKRGETPYFGSKCLQGQETTVEKVFTDAAGTSESPDFADLASSELLGQGNTGLVWATPGSTVVLKVPVKCNLPYPSSLKREVDETPLVVQILAKLKEAFPEFTALAQASVPQVQAVYLKASGSDRLIQGLVKSFVTGKDYAKLKATDPDFAAAKQAIKEFFEAAIMYETLKGEMVTRRGAAHLADFELENFMWGTLPGEAVPHLILLDLQALINSRSMFSDIPGRATEYASNWVQHNREAGDIFGAWHTKFGDLTNKYALETYAKTLKIHEEREARARAQSAAALEAENKEPKSLFQEEATP
eukprot:gnl/Hemi2/1159_TR414_c0_g1_i1.p1 gnl/Hemi2/1159_TR414_c0_g1~~gnl/Hemi2/1159_TR414_c0_g1_i1.p1  ORF type:complete len:389 (+),score=131.46 gnl/Hemi2/1159_TR414_c0_g1_i1:129-1169(+)